MDGYLSRVVKKIESSRKDGKSNRGDYVLHKHWHATVHAFREADAFIRVTGEL